ncbi:MAG: PAS domain-containing protein, partial [Cocleimonas sp.]
MLKDELKCVLIGLNIKIYNDLARLVKSIDNSARFKQVENTPSALTATLKTINGPSLIFISDEVSFSLELLSDLIWQYHADAIVVIVSKKASTVTIKKPFNNTQFSRIKLDNNNPESESILQFLIQFSREKAEFRNCKSLLGVSEKRCQWLVDSSREAVAFISRDMQWYANASYLTLFGITSVQELRSITVKDLITADEHLLFDAFLQNQTKSNATKRSIMVSMKKLNGSSFRANAYLIPSVFKGHKCYQLWVREINSISSSKEGNSESQEIKQPSSASSKAFDLKTESQDSKNTNPFSALVNKESEVNDSKTYKSATNITPTEQLKEVIESSIKQPKQNTYNQNSLLKGVIRRKEARIVVQPLTYLKQNESQNKQVIKHQVLSLKVAAAQKKGVDDLLVNLPESFNDQMRSVFWEKVKFARMLQTLIQREKVSDNLLLRVQEASMIDDSFIDWLTPGLKRLGDKSQNLIFLIPSNINESEYKKTLLFIKKIRTFKCKIA